MGLDYGSKTVGVALSDALGLIASPYETLKREKEGKLRPTLRRIVELCRKEDVELIVLGLPLNMDDSEGERVERTKGFKRLLELRLAASGLDVAVIFWDERLTTVEAREILERAEITKSDQKTYIDSVAASIILSDYMENRKDEDGRQDHHDNG